MISPDAKNYRFNMALDIKQTIKISKNISIIDKDGTIFPLFWEQFNTIADKVDKTNHLNMYDISQLAYVSTQMGLVGLQT